MVTPILEPHSLHPANWSLLVMKTHAMSSQGLDILTTEKSVVSLNLGA
jgi:hypothetical protein